MVLMEPWVPKDLKATQGIKVTKETPEPQVPKDRKVKPDLWGLRACKAKKVTKVIREKRVILAIKETPGQV
jgi:hypothetical protein